MVQLVLGISLLSACLIDRELYEQRKEELTDHDGDSFAQEDDCDDSDVTVFPGAAETCDAVDQDCDGEIDEGASDAPTWYPDADGDTFGDGGAEGSVACTAPVGHVGNGLDCDDSVTAVNPDAGETAYDGVDDDCDGADLTDVDGDGYDAEAAGGDDCDDEDDASNPGADEGWLDDGVDNDCDGDTHDPVAWERGGDRDDGLRR